MTERNPVRDAVRYALTAGVAASFVGAPAATLAQDDVEQRIGTRFNHSVKDILREIVGIWEYRVCVGFTYPGRMVCSEMAD